MAKDCNMIIILFVILKKIQKSHKMKVIRRKNSNFVPETNKDLNMSVQSNNRHQVRAKKGFSMIGYTKMDLGIAKYHFEIGAGEVNFDWV